MNHHRESVVPDHPDVSIVMRVRNGEKWLSDTLKHVFGQNLDGTFEVIIVDNESTDRSLEICKSFPTRILHITRDEFSFGRSLNRGCEAARGSVIVSMSQDTIPIGDYWLRTLVDYCRRPGIVGSSGLENLAYHRQGSVQHEPVIRLANQLEETLKKGGIGFHNANSAFLRDVWEKIPFDEEVVFGEDSCWAAAVLAAGHSLIVGVPAIVCHTSHNDEPFKQRARRYYLAIYERYRRGWSPRVRLHTVILLLLKGILRSILKAAKLVVTETAMGAVRAYATYKGSSQYEALKRPNVADHLTRK